jgi:hypothetical protein
LKLYSTHKLLVYADDVNILGRSLHAVKKNTKALVAASEEIGLEVNTEKTKYMFMSHDQNVGRKHSLKTDSSSNQSKYPTRCKLVIEFIISTFIEGSTCFERHTAHHQEL